MFAYFVRVTFAIGIGVLITFAAVQALDTTETLTGNLRMLPVGAVCFVSLALGRWLRKPLD